MAYTPIGWQDLPSEETPISADNLNHMDEQIKANADNIEGVVDFTHRIDGHFVSSADTSSLTVLETGIYTINNYDGAIVDCPMGGLGSIVCSKPQPDYAIQTFTHQRGDVFTRNCDNGNWSDWKLITNSVSDAYNPSKTYAQSEFCIYNNTLWKSKVNNNTGNTPAEGSYWTATNVGELFKFNKNSTTFVHVDLDKNEAYAPVMTKIGAMCNASGILHSINSIPNNFAELFYLPEGYRPLVDCKFVAENGAVLDIAAWNGSVRLSNTGTSLSPDGWYSFNIMYISTL